MTDYVVDASVALKWFVPETDSGLAEQVLISGKKLHAPRFLMLETANAAWKNWRKGLIDRSVVESVEIRLPKLIEVWFADEDVYQDALIMALDLRHPIFDCLYLAVANKLGCQTISADKRLLALARPGRAIALDDWLFGRETTALE